MIFRVGSMFSSGFFRIGSFGCSFFRRCILVKVSV